MLLVYFFKTYRNVLPEGLGKFAWQESNDKLESVAIKWLNQDAERERLSNDALMSEQARVALSANRAAWIAAITAIIMVVIDMVSRIIAYLA